MLFEQPPLKTTFLTIKIYKKNIRIDTKTKAIERESKKTI